MPDKSTATAALLAVVLVASLVVVGAPLNVQQMDDTATQETSYLRVAHTSPDAPAVDVTLGNETVLEGVAFGDVSDYLTVAAGTYNVTISVAADGAEVFDGNVTLEPRTATTLAASGEVSENATREFAPVAFEDDALEPGENESAVRVVHLSPDAPAVDVTVNTGNGTVVLAENATFGNASDYVTVPAGNYTVDIRAATAGNNGTVVTTVDLSLEGGTAYSAMAVGYLNADAAPADTPFEVVVTEDAETTITVPSDEEEMTEDEEETEEGEEEEETEEGEEEEETEEGEEEEETEEGEEEDEEATETEA
jgi:hypothetical protein